MKSNCRLVVYQVVAAMLALAPVGKAHAQELFTSMFVAAGNDFGAVGPHGTGDPIDSLSNTVVFNGLDSHSNPQAMTMVGDTWAAADYGVLRSRTRVSLQNLYYNPTNPAYRDGNSINPAGSPDLFLSDSRASFFDLLTFSGGTDPDATVQFVFTLDGALSQSQANIGYAFLEFGYNGSLEDWSTTAAHTVITTNPFPVFWDTAVPVITTHITDFRFDLAGGQLQFPTPYTEGQNVFSDVDFYNTLRLTGILIHNSNGDLFSDFTTQSASGTQYPIHDAAVPEPSALLLPIALMVSGALTWRRRAPS